MPSYFTRSVPLLCALALCPAAALAQQNPGAATTMREAPAVGPLAGEDGNPVPVAAALAQTDPGASRAMSFGASTGECRDTVPGGTLFAAAYAIVLLVLGAWLAAMARGQSALALSLERLEVQLERKREELSRPAGEPRP